MLSLTLTKPDDFHLHVRDGDVMRSIINHSAAQFARAIIMPNLKEPVILTDMALAYRKRILSAVDKQYQFEPLMTLYLTDNTSVFEIKKAAENGIKALKYYPSGVTTHSDQGVTDIKKTYAVLDAMTQYGLPLLVHGEVNDVDVDIFERETIFIDRILMPLVDHFPELNIVFEHITTKSAADFVTQAGKHVAATITPQHLLLNRNDLFKGGLQPHHYCLPILKTEENRKAILAAATSGNKKFFAGTDSAPHARFTKERACGCAGVYSAHIALELYAEAFESEHALDKLECFLSIHGADFYGLPHNADQITLLKQDQAVPASFSLGDDELIPLRAQGVCAWQLKK